MKKYLVKSENKSGEWAMFIGRWQPWHDGHQWLIDQALQEGKKVFLCIRDVQVDDKNPWPAQQIEIELKRKLWKYIGEEKLKITIIPDIESINIGRGVGYDIIEHVPPQEIHDISATSIREQMKLEGKL
jgi:nicotinamide mononucleotide adenylyltransferase